MERSKASVSTPPAGVRTPGTSTTSGRVAMVAGIDDTARHAVINYEKWMAAGNTTQVLDNYGFLTSPTHRRKVVTWAVERASKGDLQPLLAIGLDDPDSSVRRHMHGLLVSLPFEPLWRRISGARFSTKEQCTVAQILGRCKDPRAGRMLAGLADHHSSMVRECALQALANFPVTESLQLPIFSRHLKQDSNPTVQLRAAEGLARLGSSEAVRTLTVAAAQETATPEIKAVAAGAEAKHRPKTSTEESSGKLTKVKVAKPFPTDVVIKVAAVLLCLGFAGYRLKEPVIRWYDKKFPAAAQAPAP